MLVKYFHSNLPAEPLFSLTVDPELGLVISPLFSADVFNPDQFRAVLRAAIAANEDVVTVKTCGGNLREACQKILRHISGPDRNCIRREFFDDGEEC